MSDSLIDALGVLISIQRWNLMPRAEIWTEAENIGYYTHLAYAISRRQKFSDEMSHHVLLRCLLKSFNKHYLSDIPVDSREVVKRTDEGAWKSIIDEAASRSAQLFPMEVTEYVKSYMTYEGKYNAGDERKRGEIEDLIKYCQYVTAVLEIETNLKVYEIPAYQEKLDNLNHKLRDLPDLDKLNSLHSEMRVYLFSVRKLKYVRRWNRINRVIESSVLAHSFLVSIFALVFSRLHKDEIERLSLDMDAFSYQCLKRALFHDFPESLTGDIISPVKDIINRLYRPGWASVEKEMIDDFRKFIPEDILKTIQAEGLFEDLSKDNLNSINSLVFDCDQLALLLECVYEKRLGKIPDEMAVAYRKYLSRLQNSEWKRVREFANQVRVDYP